MTPEKVRAAVDRMRKHLTCEPLDRTNDPYSPHTGDYDLQWVDLLTIRDAYFAEHPKDENEPVTEEWLDVIAPRGDRLVNLWVLYDARGCRHFMQQGHNCFYIDSQPVVHRWQVRQYAEVFGIELNNERAEDGRTEQRTKIDTRQD